MNWVKASERLPLHCGIQNKVVIRGDGFVAYGFRNFSKENPEMYYEYGNKSFLTNNVEWLDESSINTPSEPVTDSLIYNVNKFEEGLSELTPEESKEYSEEITSLRAKFSIALKEKGLDDIRLDEIISYADKVIPPMTHPYGKAWEQPPLTDIIIGVKYAVMSEKTFDQLLDYSHSTPTGVYEGKMWRSKGKIEVGRSEFYHGEIKEIDYLHWWSESEDPDKCKHNIRNILLV